MSIAAGKLRERVAIQEKNLVDNGRGGRARPSGGPDWVNVAGADAIRAEIVPLRGDEALSNAILRATQVYRVTIRNRPGLTAAHRLLWGTVALNIKALARSVDRREIVMTCEAGLPG